MGSTCFGHYYAYHQELATVMLIAIIGRALRAAGYIARAITCSPDTTPA